MKPGASLIACLVLSFGILLAAAAIAQPTHDHTPLLTPNAIATERVVTYSFPATVPREYRGRWSEAALATFRPYSEANKAIVRSCLAQWGDAAGITFREVPEGTIRYMAFDLRSLDPGWASGGNTLPPPESDVFIQKGRERDVWLCLHESGHALGLKHPHETRGYHPDRGWYAIPYLPADLQYETVMAYRSRPRQTLGRIDVEAIRAKYGPPQN